jgi:predicted RNA-binding Zn-ribbon protein involved in translation (DUF1610 family)
VSDFERDPADRARSLVDWRSDPVIDALAPAVITCIDCGGRAFLLTTWEAGTVPEPGDLTTYRCEDCRDRWDLLIPEE